MTHTRAGSRLNGIRRTYIHRRAFPKQRQRDLQSGRFARSKRGIFGSKRS